MKPSAYIQSVLADDLDCQVFSQVPKTVPPEFCLHTVASNVPVSNGGPLESMDTTVTVACVARSNDRAWDLATRALGALNTAYERDYARAGTGLGYFSVEALPVKQPKVAAVTAQDAHEYDAVYRLVFTAA